MQANEPKFENKSGTRKPYEPPALVTISLRPGEAVLGTCTSSSHQGPMSMPCTALKCPIAGS